MTTKFFKRKKPSSYTRHLLVPMECCKIVSMSISDQRPYRNHFAELDACIPQIHFRMQHGRGKIFLLLID